MGLDGVELVMAIEEEFGIRIADAEAEKMETPRAMIDFLWTRHERGELFTQPQPHPGVLQRLGLIKPPEYSLKEKVRTRELLAERVREIIREQLGIGEFSDDQRFIEDLGVG